MGAAVGAATPDSSRPSKQLERSPNGIRTRAAGVKDQNPRPLDDGTLQSKA